MVVMVAVFNRFEIHFKKQSKKMNSLRKTFVLYNRNAPATDLAPFAATVLELLMRLTVACRAYRRELKKYGRF